MSAFKNIKGRNSIIYHPRQGCLFVIFSNTFNKDFCLAPFPSLWESLYHSERGQMRGWEFYIWCSEIVFRPYIMMIKSGFWVILLIMDEDVPRHVYLYTIFSHFSVQTQWFSIISNNKEKRISSPYFSPSPSAIYLSQWRFLRHSRKNCSVGIHTYVSF